MQFPKKKKTNFLTYVRLYNLVIWLILKFQMLFQLFDSWKTQITY